jgi:hypothetical protein
MKKVLRLTESDLIKMVKKIIEEQGTGNDRIANIASMLQSVKTVNRPTLVIMNPNSDYNNIPWANYVSDNKVTPQEIQQAKMLISKMGGSISPNPGPGPGPGPGSVSRTVKATKPGPGSVSGGTKPSGV